MADTTHVGGNPIRSGTAEKWLRNAVASRDGLATGEPRAKDGPFCMQAQIHAVPKETVSRRRVAGWSDSAGETSRRRD
jgi:hypothetical protein